MRQRYDDVRTAVTAAGPTLIRRRVVRHAVTFAALLALAAPAAPQPRGDASASVAAVSLAWLLTKRNVVAPVASASHAAQVIELMAASTIQLSRHQLAALDRASA